MRTPSEPPKRPPFKVAGVATIKHLNFRKEGPDDDKVLAVDIKVEFERIDRNICAWFDDALSAFLWRHETESLIARNVYLQPIQFANQIEGAIVRIGGRTFKGCDVKKFTFLPHDGGVMDFGCSVAVYPSSDEAAELTKWLNDSAKMRIEGPADLFDSAPAADSAAASK